MLEIFRSAREGLIRFLTGTGIPDLLDLNEPAERDKRLEERLTGSIGGRFLLREKK